jgi:hypothetical protein
MRLGPGAARLQEGPKSSGDSCQTEERTLPTMPHFPSGLLLEVLPLPSGCLPGPPLVMLWSNGDCDRGRALALLCGSQLCRGGEGSVENSDPAGTLPAGNNNNHKGSSSEHFHNDVLTSPTTTPGKSKSRCYCPHPILLMIYIYI